MRQTNIATGSVFGGQANGASLASTPISGNHSARLSQASGGYLRQDLNDPWELLADFSVEFDLAVGNTGAGNRAFNLIIPHPVGDRAGEINVKIDGTEDGKGDIQVFSFGTGWVTALADAIEFSADENNLVVNQVVIEGDYSGETPFYRIQVGGDTSDPLTVWLSDGPKPGERISRLDFSTDRIAASAWAVVDNVDVNGPSLVASPVEGDGDFAFGSVFLADLSTDTETRAVRFVNNQDEELTIQEISILDDSEGAFSIGNAPETPISLAGAQSFEVEVVLAEGVTGRQLIGNLGIDFNHSGDPQGAPLSGLEQVLSAIIFTTGDKFSLNANPSLDTNLNDWTAGAGGVQVAPGFAESSQKVRLRGRTDGSEPDSFGQNSIPSGASAFEIDFLFTVPDFQTAVGSSPDGAFLDRSFQFVIHSDTNIPTASNGVWSDAHAESAMINLAYLPGGNGSSGEGFYLFDGDSWQHLPELGTVQESIDADEDGVLDSMSGDTVNVHQLSLTGSSFGKQDAVYDIAISEANSTNMAATATNLTASHSTSITEYTPAAYTFTTGDRSNSSGNGPDDPAWSSSFWIDEVIYTVPDTLPFPVLTVTEEPDLIQMWPDSGRTTLTIRNGGLGADLDVAAIDFGDSGYSMISPSTPFSLAPGATETLTIELDSTGTTEEDLIGSEMLIDSNNVVTSTTVLPVEGMVFAPGNYIFGSFEVPGTDPENGTDTFAGWYEGQQTPEGSMAVPGLVDGSPTAAYLDDTGWMEGGLLEPVADFELETYFAIKPDSGRLFAMVLQTDTGNTLNLRYEDGTLSAFSGAWQTLFDVNLAGSIDSEGNGSLDDGGDTKVVYRLRVTGRNWDDANAAEYDVSVYDSDGGLLGTATNQQHFQASVVGEPLRSINFTTRYGGNPGFWVDDVMVTNLAEPARPDVGITFVDFVPASQEVTLRWKDVGENYEILATDDLAASDANDLVIEVDSSNGTLDTTTYPEEVQFIFQDSGAMGSKRFWQVRQDLP